MFLTAPGYWRRRKRISVLTVYLKVLILLFMLFPVIAVVLVAEEKVLLEFTDNDSRGGWLSGDMIVTYPEKSAKISKYVLLWGNNPHKRLGMYLPIVTLKSEKSGNRFRIKFNSTKVPPSATHFLLYSRNEKDEETEHYSLSLIDKGVPSNKSQEIYFEQTAKNGNRIQGKISLTRAWDERDLTHYAVYWGKGPETILRTQPPVTVIEKKSWFGSRPAELWRSGVWQSAALY
jgi:hypothetical protein